MPRWLFKYKRTRESVNNSFQCFLILLLEYFKAALLETENTVAETSRQASSQKHHSSGEKHVSWFVVSVVIAYPQGKMCATSTLTPSSLWCMEIELISNFVNTVTRLACHLRLTVGFFLSFWDRIKNVNTHFSKRKGRSGSLPKNRIAGCLLYQKPH